MSRPGTASAVPSASAARSGTRGAARTKTKGGASGVDKATTTINGANSTKLTAATSAAPRVPEIVKRLMNVQRPESAARRLSDASLALEAAAAADHLNYAEGVMEVNQRPAAAAAEAPSGIASAPLTILAIDDDDDNDDGGGGGDDDDDYLAATAAVADHGNNKRDDATALSLTVQLQPCVPINRLNFERIPGIDAPPRATVFEHVEGCRHCADLYTHFTLPNGKRGHLFDQGSKTVERAPASTVLPPPRPTSLARLCQLSFPYVAALERLSIPRVTKNTGVFTPVPPPAPIPELHTLPVVNPNDMSKEMFGNIRVDPPRVAVVPEDVVVEIDETVKEDVNLGPPWKLEVGPACNAS